MERNQLSFRSARQNGLAASLFAAVGLALLGACNGGTGSGASQVGVPGREETKPGSTETFFVDENQGGGAILW
jgi:hypothetical protein